MKKLICVCFILLCLCSCAAEEVAPVTEETLPAAAEDQLAMEETAPVIPESEVVCDKGVPYRMVFHGKEDYELFCSLADLSDEEMREKLREQELW